MDKWEGSTEGKTVALGYGMLTAYAYIASLGYAAVTGVCHVNARRHESLVNK